MSSFLSLLMLGSSVLVVKRFLGTSLFQQAVLLYNCFVLNFVEPVELHVYTSSSYGVSLRVRFDVYLISIKSKIE